MNPFSTAMPALNEKPWSERIPPQARAVRLAVAWAMLAVGFLFGGCATGVTAWCPEHGVRGQMIGRETMSSQLREISGRFTGDYRTGEILVYQHGGHTFRTAQWTAGTPRMMELPPVPIP